MKFSFSTIYSCLQRADREGVFLLYSSLKQEKSCPLGGELHVSNATGVVLSEENFLSGRA